MGRRAAPRLVNHRHLAELMGVATETIRGWIDSGHLVSHSRVGKTYFFRSEDVEHYFKTGRWVREKASEDADHPV